MPSAAQKVFDIPELVEKVLLCLWWNQLFTLLRTNRSFHETILRSIKLRRKMHLSYKEPFEIADLRYPVSINARIPLVMRDHHYKTNMSYPPFVTTIVELVFGRKLNVSPFMFGNESQGASGKRTITVVFDLLTIPQEADRTRTIGMRGLHGVAASRGDESWLRMKLTHECVPLRVELWIWLENSLFYREILEFAAGEGTVGDAVAEMAQVGRKTHKEHEQRKRELLEK